MAQDTTAPIVLYTGDGSTTVFSVPFDKGNYGDIKVAFVRRGLTSYTYNPTTFTVSGKLYAWVSSLTTYYTHTPQPATGAAVYDANDVDQGITVTYYSGSVVTIAGRTHTRTQSSDIDTHTLLTWTGDTLTTDDIICITRETESSQPYELPQNQKNIEGALDNLERQVQELQATAKTALTVDPSFETTLQKMSPVSWLQTIIRCTNLSVRALRYTTPWLEYSLDDPDVKTEDKTWYKLLNTTNIQSIYEKVTTDTETGYQIHSVYYKDSTGVERLLSYDPVASEARLTEVEDKVDTLDTRLTGEIEIRRASDDEIKEDVTTLGTTIGGFDDRIDAVETGLDEVAEDLDANYYTKAEVDQKVTGLYNIKGAVNYVADLPTDASNGDVYNVKYRGTSGTTPYGMNFVWDGSEWDELGDTFAMTAYRTAADQDIIDAGKQDTLTAGTCMEITANNTINMTGKFGQSFTMANNVLTLKDQDGTALSNTVLAVGVDAEYTAADEDIEFNDAAEGDYTYLEELIEANTTAINNHKADKNNPHEVTKAQVGLSNVDNTSDADKPISTATQTALDGKVNTSDIEDSVTSESVTKVLSAKQGKLLNDEITALKARGKFLALWNCSTGLAVTNPGTLPYSYTTGDYYVVSVIGTTNKKPKGSSYNADPESSEAESNTVAVNDTYYYDGSAWALLHGAEIQVTFASLGGDAYDNSSLSAALNSKQGTLTAGTNITISGTTISATDTTYTAGTGIAISASNVISTTGQDLTAGTGIEIINSAITTNNIIFRRWTQGS